MARIDIKSTGTTLDTGILQLENGVAMDATLRSVTDQSNTTSPLKLSTTLVQTTSTLKITTQDNPYIDAEDGTGSNRFTVGRATSSQQVNVDFASNPTGSTTAVGAIRTYQDGVNLSEAMTFIEDGSVGIGTTAPVGILHIKKTAANTRLAIDGDAGFNRLISYRTAGLQRFGLYTNNTAESGSNVGSDFAIRAYNDAGTLLNTPVFIKRSTGNVGINTLTGTAKLQVVGSGSTTATTSLLLQNSAGTQLGYVDDSGRWNVGQGTNPSGRVLFVNGSAEIATTLNVSGSFTASASTNQIGNLQLLTTGTAAATGLGILAANRALNFQSYDGLNGALFDFTQYSSAIPQLSTLSKGIIRVRNIGFSDGNLDNLQGNTLWLEPTYNFTNGAYSNLIARGIYYNPTLTSLLGTKHYGIQTTSGGAYINTATPNATAALQVDSTTQGFLPPRMTNAQRTAIGTPAVGLMVYCTDAVEGLYVYKSTGWTFII
jgi:hypothetical protein